MHKPIVCFSPRPMFQAMDDMGCTALHEAATFNQIHVASALIERGASMLTSDKDRCTALHQAALEGFVDVAKLMIEKSEEMRADTTQVRSAFFPHSQQTRVVEPLCV